MANCIVPIGGKNYVPARAIPHMTADLVTPLAVTKLLKGEERHFFARSYQKENGSLQPIDAANWAIPESDQAAFAKAEASRMVKIEALPAGVLVSFDDLAAAFETCCIDPHRWDDEFTSSPSFVGALLTNPFMSSETQKSVMEGVDVPSQNLPTTAPTPKTPSGAANAKKATDHDEALQDRANAYAQQVYAQSKKWPTKLAVAKTLKGRGGADVDNLKEATICRRIREKDWKKT